MEKIYNIILLTLLLIFACSKEDLKPLGIIDPAMLKHVTANISFCTQNPENAKSFIKYIFILDKSSSNQVLPGTDPIGARRYGPIQNFMSNQIVDPTVSYMLINFSSDATQVTNFVDKPTFDTEILNQKNLTSPIPPLISNDAGWTDYMDALDLAEIIITNDITTNQNTLPDVVTTHYILFFISDGEPMDELGNPQNPTVIENKATVLGSLAGNPNYKEWIESIQMHTGYYYGTAIGDPPNPIAQNLLQQMATNLNGEYFEFPGGQAIDFSKFVLPERIVKHVHREVFVTNMNVMWENGKDLVPDNDGDGLSDFVERILGSNPNKDDSDGNSVSDGVEYFATTKPCGDPTCDPLLANPYNSCFGFIDPAWVSGPNKYIDQDGDLLNNCEESALLNSNIFSFDTNDDWVPDYLAVRHGGISYLSTGGDSGALLDPDADGATNYGELKINTPWDFDNNKIPGLKMQKYNLKQVSEDKNQTCYKLTVGNIMAYGDGNTILVILLEKKSLDNTRYMRWAKKWVENSNEVVFKDSDFQ